MTLEQLQAQLAAVPADGQLPASATKDDEQATQAQRTLLDQRLRRAREATETLAALGNADTNVVWLDHLNAWRKALCDELLTIKSPIRDAKVMGLSQNLTLSIRCIDFGPGALKDSGRELTNLRLGALMIESGYEAVGADPERSYVGVMPWFGTVKETEQRIAALAEKRAQAQGALDEALMDDDAREKQEADAKQLRDAFNAQPQRKTRVDGTQYDKFPDGRRVEVTS